MLSTVSIIIRPHQQFSFKILLVARSSVILSLCGALYGSGDWMLHFNISLRLVLLEWLIQQKILICNYAKFTLATSRESRRVSSAVGLPPLCF